MSHNGLCGQLTGNDTNVQSVQVKNIFLKHDRHDMM